MVTSTRKSARALALFAMTTALTAPLLPRQTLADTIKIGVLAQLVGAAAADGQEIVRGVQLAIDEANAGGGVNGYMFELVIGDTRAGAASDVTAAVERLIGDPDVHFIAAGYASLTGFEIENMAEAQMPYVLSGPSGQTRDIIAPDPEKYWCCWSLTPSYDAYGTDVTRLFDALAETDVITLGAPKTVALISSDNAYSSDIYDGMKEEIAISGWRQTVDEVVPFGEINDWRTVLSKIRQMPPDLVVNLDFLPANSASFLNQFMEKPTRSFVFLQYAPSVPEFLTLTGKNAEGIIYNLLGGALMSDKHPRGREVIEKFRKKFNMEPGTYGPALYEITNLYFDALRKVKNPSDHRAIADAIGVSDKVAAQGRIKFDPETHLAMQGDDYIPIQFFQFQDAERIVIYPEKYATGTFRLPEWLE